MQFFAYFLMFFDLFFVSKRLKIMVAYRMLPKKLLIYVIFGNYTNCILKNEYMQFVQNRESIFLYQKSYEKYMILIIFGNFFGHFVNINEFLAAKCGFYGQYIQKCIGQ